MYNHLDLVLCATAASIGFLHTIFGPDHYLPFVAMSKAGNWSFRKTLSITLLCGLGHVASSVAIGAAGLLLGTMVTRLEGLESLRGDWAAWLLIVFGATYALWGLLQAVRGSSHKHRFSYSEKHAPADNSKTDHGKVNLNPVPDGDTQPGNSMTLWMLFLVFLLGPCEPLIPLLMYPAAKENYLTLSFVVLTFTAVTLATMTSAVVFLTQGLKWIDGHRFHRYGHALAGSAVLCCGLMIKLGL